MDQILETWLSFILSEANHRVSYVEQWVAKRLETLKQLIGPTLRVEEFSDDRLGDVLRYLNDDQSWVAIEQALGQRTIRVYQLPQERSAWIAPRCRCTTTRPGLA